MRQQQRIALVDDHGDGTTMVHGRGFFPALAPFTYVQKAPQGILVPSIRLSELLVELIAMGYVIKPWSTTSPPAAGTGPATGPAPECAECGRPFRRGQPVPAICPGCGASLRLLEYDHDSGTHRNYRPGPGHAG